MEPANRRALAWILGATMVCVLATAGHADNNRIGVAAGLVIPTTFEVGDTSPTTDPGPIVTFTFDRVVHSRFDLGLFVAGGGFSAGEPEQLVTLFELGVGGHFRQPLGDVALLRVGAGIGYRRLFADLATYDRVQGLAVNADAELSYPLFPGFIGQLKIGFLSQPIGRNNQADVTWAAMPYLAIGAVFLPR